MAGFGGISRSTGAIVAMDSWSWPLSRRGDGVIVPVSIPGVRGVHVAGLSRIPGGAGLTSASSEAAGGVKMESARTERQLAASAVLLTPPDVRS
jgi:hypothetical protein